MDVENTEMADVFFSVIMPAYNSEKTISEAIQSVLKQTYKNFELIVINDCSLDYTEQIVKNFMSIDSRIKIISNAKNLGVSESRNRGIKKAKYEWIAFLDSDDLWVSTKLEKQLSYILKTPEVPIFFTGSAFIGMDNEKYNYILNVPAFINYKQLLKQNVISCSSVVVKKNELLKYPMHKDSNIHEDFATWLKILKNKSYAVGINEPLLIYRISKYGKSGNKIRASRMQWRTYRYVGLNIFDSVWNFVFYFVRSMKKYICIKRSLELEN